MNSLLSIVLLIQYSICVLLYTHSTLLKHLKALYNSISGTKYDRDNPIFSAERGDQSDRAEPPN